MPVYEENFKVNGQKVYFIRCYVDGPNGRKQIKRHNKKDWIGIIGKRLAQQEEIRLVNKKYNDYENITIDEIAKDYLNNMQKNLKETTYLKNRDNYILYIKPIFGNRIANSITTKDILNWKNNLLSKDFALNYLKGFYTTFSSLLNFGVKYYNLSKNVVRIEGNFKNARGRKKEDYKVLTEEQFKMAIKNETNIYYFVAFNILFWTGIRRGEMLALNINDLDFNNNLITIDESYNPKTQKKYDDPKTLKSNRILPVKKELMDLIKKIADMNTDKSGYIFKRNITLSTLKRKSDKNLESIGFEKKNFIRIHDYRHSFATMCIHNKVPIQIISDYMGHENISITWDTYGHLYPDEKYNLINTLNINNINLIKETRPNASPKEISNLCNAI